uniref:protein FAR1-RELATED SEQUENCE 6-like n=1 Tax=Erigeron canadensis TaxID=72917 RepID=UPI001CB99EAF|nr:protein FAR1-RELATED SEQUENCE 6-like [Erigeron canadensis]
MSDFSLKNDTWFKYMFQIRSKWIPAYFTDTPMFGLMRTTSRSESENAFFSYFTRQGANLVHFMSGFESAMLKQRSTQEKLDADDIKKSRTLCTKLNIEKHASKIYTKTVFEIVQKEIEASLYACSVDQMTIEGDCKVYLINERLGKKTLDTGKNVIQYKVLYNRQDGSVMCTCRHYLRYGRLCRHCFVGLNNNNVEEIPAQYIMRRWTKGIIQPDLRSRRNRFKNANMGTQKLVTDVTSVVEDCLHLLVNDEKKLTEFLEKMKDLKKKVEDEIPKQPSKKKNDVIEKMTGVPKPDTNRIKNPPVSSYKGCFRDKCLMGGKEKGIIESNKRKTNCSLCGGTNHNMRTCGQKKQKPN